MDSKLDDRRVGPASVPSYLTSPVLIRPNNNNNTRCGGKGYQKNSKQANLKRLYIYIYINDI